MVVQHEDDGEPLDHLGVIPAEIHGRPTLSWVHASGFSRGRTLFLVLGCDEP